MSSTCSVCDARFVGDEPACAACGERRVPITEVSIGRDRLCDVVIDSPFVSARHARMTLAPSGNLVVTDEGSRNGTFVDGARVERAELTLADELRLGSAAVPLTHRAIASLLLHAGRTFDARVGFTLGGSPECDVVVRHPSVKPVHAVVRVHGPGDVDIRDLSEGSLFVDRRGFSVERAHLLPGSVIWLGDCPIPLAVLLQRIDGLDRARVSPRTESAIFIPDTEAITVGRARNNTVVIDHRSVSRYHAKLVQHPSGALRLFDLGSANGTYFRGEPVGEEPVVVEPGQSFVVGAVELLVGERGTIVDVRRPRVALDLEHVSVVVRDRDATTSKVLLDDVTIAIAPGELVGLLGPSGAGKSTLLATMLGLVRPTVGVVKVNGHPLAEVEESFRASLGYVPQDDIVHPELTVAETLRYACRLRLPRDMPEEDVEAAITRTLAEVGLTEQRDLQIGSPEDKVLSGGQRRRVDLAVELVTDPAVLVLDEPTSGLSWSDAADVISTLRKLANGGRTIVVTIHQPDVQEYESFDSVAILGQGGKLLFFGPPSPESYDFFGAARGRPRAIFDRLEQMSVAHWRARFEASEVFDRYVTDREGTRSQTTPLYLATPRPRSRLRQLRTLLGRTVRLTLRQRATMALMLLQAPLLGLLIGFASQGNARIPVASFGCLSTTDEAYFDTCVGRDDTRACDNGIAVAAELASHPGWSWRDAETRRRVERALAFRREPVRDPRTGLLSVVLSVFLPMVIVSAMTLVGERAIFLRERLAGTDPTAYVLARFLVLAALGCVVTVLNLSVSIPLLGLRGGLLPYYVVGAMVAATATAFGLLLSAIVKRPQTALWGINFLVIPQLLFAGTITRLSGASAFASKLTATRPALEALVHVHFRAPGGPVAPCQLARWLESVPGYAEALPHPILAAATSLGALTLVTLVATVAVTAFRRP